MPEIDKSGLPDKELKILIIYSNELPDQSAVDALLNEAGCNYTNIVFATATEVAGGGINPGNFDHVIAILDDALATDDATEESAIAVAQCGRAIVGIWATESESDSIHPAVTQYGKAQVPWEPSALAVALGTQCPQPLQTQSGKQSTHHKITPNKC